MPELPEVHTITEDLKDEIIGYKIYKAAGDKYMRLLLTGNTITNVSRLAKNILIKLSSGPTLRIHLAMTGRIFIKNEEEPQDKWTRLILYLVNREKKKKLIFSDMRMFGKIELLQEKDLNKLKNKYGADIFEEEITPQQFLELIKSKNSNIKTVLLDQKIVSGLGNIYVTDALFLSGIHPETKTKHINLKLAGKLLENIKKVLKEGIKHRGATLPDKMYVDPLGNPGNYQNFFKIYMREKCPVCNSKVQNVKIGGRSSFFCPACQKLSGGLF